MQAWRAYRLLQALCQIDPRAVELILPRIGEQLEAGDFAEIAHEEAHRLGHSPQQWLDDYTAARAAQKARAPVGNESTTG